MSEHRNGIWKIGGVLLGSLITVITMLSLFITAGLRTDIGRLDNKLMLHLTNHELHNPRENSVSKAEFNTYRYFAEASINDVKVKLNEIQKELYVQNK